MPLSRCVAFIQLVDEKEEREQTPLERSKRRRAEQDIKVSRSVKRLDDASAFVGRDENLFYRIEKRRSKGVCRGRKTEQQRAQSVSKSMFQEGVIERKMQRVKETTSVDRVHPSCYAIPT